MRGWIVGLAAAVVFFGTQNAKGAVIFTEDVTFVDGDVYWSVEIHEDAHAEVLGGLFENRFQLYDNSTAHVVGGDFRGGFAATDSSRASIHPGTYINTYINVRGSAEVNLFGGRMPDNWLAADADCIVNFYVDDFVYTPGGGIHGEGYITGTWTTGGTFQVSLRNRYGGDADPTWTHIVMHTPCGPHPLIPEPSTFAIWSLLGILGTVGWWRRRKA